MFATSTRNTTYERLEGGIGMEGMGGGGGPGHRPSPANAGSINKRLAWKKVAIGCGVLLGIVWFFGPRRVGFSAELATPGLEDGYPLEAKIPLPMQSPALDKGPSPSSSPSPVSAVPSPVPTSPETDPDPLKTVHCTVSYAPYLPLVQYALMIDAGSTGSRIHIYKFNHCGASPAYEYEVFRMVQPGLSGRAKSKTQTAELDAEGAAESLDVLLDEAIKVVPGALHRCTPLAVKATAGLRFLGAAESLAILKAVERRLRERYPFPVVGDGGTAGAERVEGGVAIMDGKDEGVYAWITANYLTGAVGADADEAVATHAVLDLGGGSTQIVFEPEMGGELGAGLDTGSWGGVLKDGEHKYELVFGGRRRVLYQHSYLGYGLKSARESVHRVVEFMDSLRGSRSSGTDGLPRVANPCLAQRTSKEVDVPMWDGKDKVRVLMAGEDVGNFEACNRVLELVMAKDAICEVKPCSFNGVYQPLLLDAFPTGKILLLSYFYDRIVPLIPPPPEGAQPRITLATIATLARQVCAGPSSWLDQWGAYPDVMEELEDRPEWCLDLTFMHALLGLGYGFVEGREVELGKRIGGTELGWCLGATIAMVGNGEIRCHA